VACLASWLSQDLIRRGFRLVASAKAVFCRHSSLAAALASYRLSYDRHHRLDVPTNLMWLSKSRIPFIASFYASNCKAAQQSLFILNQGCYTHHFERAPLPFGAIYRMEQAYLRPSNWLSSGGNMVETSTLITAK